MNPPIPASDITLGLLAGGDATRLGGLDKAWLQRGGVAQVVRFTRRFTSEVCCVLVSANRNLERYADHGLPVVIDRKPGAGPLGGLDALAHACRTPWLLTLPVDLVGVNECLLPSLIAAANGNGAFSEDGNGPQPLVALWRVEALRVQARASLSRDDFAVHALQASLGMARARFDGVRFGNLNTVSDLAAAGFASP